MVKVNQQREFEMPDQVYNLYEAKTHLSHLVDRAAKGEEIVIAKAGVPLAKLVPVSKPKKKANLEAGKVRFTSQTIQIRTANEPVPCL